MDLYPDGRIPRLGGSAGRAPGGRSSPTALREPRGAGQARPPGPGRPAEAGAGPGARPGERARRAQRHAAQERDVAAVAGEIEAMVGAARAAARTSSPSRCPTRCRSTRSPEPAAVRLRRLNAAVRELSAAPRRARRRPRAPPGRLRPPPLGRRPPARQPGGPPRGSPLRRRHALGLPDADELWTTVFPTRWPALARSPTRRGRASYFAPWLIRRLRGRSSGDGRVAKRPRARAASR